MSIGDKKIKIESYDMNEGNYTFIAFKTNVNFQFRHEI